MGGRHAERESAPAPCGKNYFCGQDLRAGEAAAVEMPSGALSLITHPDGARSGLSIQSPQRAESIAESVRLLEKETGVTFGAVQGRQFLAGVGSGPFGLPTMLVCRSERVWRQRITVGSTSSTSSDTTTPSGNVTVRSHPTERDCLAVSARCRLTSAAACNFF